MEVRDDGSTLETTTIENPDKKPLVFGISAFINSDDRLEVKCDNVNLKLLDATINGLHEIRKDMLLKNPKLGVESLGRSPAVGQGLKVVEDEIN